MLPKKLLNFVWLVPFLFGCNAATDVLVGGFTADRLFDLDDATPIIPVADTSSVNSNTTPNDQPPTQPEPEGPVDVPPAMQALFGKGYFSHAFANAERVYVVESNFDGTSYSFTNDGDYIAYSVGNYSYSDDAGETIYQGGAFPTACVYNEQSQFYLCLVVLDDGDSANFILGPLENSEAYGNFEFCAATISTEDCVYGLLNEPDGAVRLSMAPAGTAVAGLAELNDDASRSSPKVNHQMAYFEQGTAGFGSKAGFGRSKSPLHELIVSARHNLLTQ